MFLSSLLTIPALRILNEYNRTSPSRIDLITKAKKNITAYEEPKRTNHKRGRPRLKGNRIKLNSFFESRKKQFRTAAAMMYGKMTEVKYYKIDLLWGQGLYQKLRFVLVWYGDTSGILVSTDLTLEPVTIIEAYSKRFRCESLYRELKQVLHAFHYHFWTKSMPRLNHFRKKSDPDPLLFITDLHERQKIINAFRATEMYMFAANVAMGLIMMISIKFDIDPSLFRYQRTPAKAKPSEANMSQYLRNLLFRHLCIRAPGYITDLIHDRCSATIQEEYQNMA